MPTDGEPLSQADHGMQPQGAPEPAPAQRNPRHRTRRRGLLTGMRVRKKVLFLHTLFSLGLAAVLLVPLRPAITEVVEQAEVNEARALLRLAIANRGALDTLGPEAQVRTGSADELGLSDTAAAQARAAPGKPVTAYLAGREPAAVAFVASSSGSGAGAYWATIVKIPEARRAVFQLYALTAVALLAVYGLVAAALELFILPQHVYDPIQRMLEADRAARAGEAPAELIPESSMPADELGEIMRSRNATIVALRRHERALADALAELQRVAGDLKRKNHLLEAARRNLADADRLASLGMMSAGIAHELNTPLAVVKGLADKLNQSPEKRLEPTEAALMVRVVRRLERLGDSLLDFARARPPETRPVELRSIVDEASTLVRLDRGGADVEFSNSVPADLLVECDADRMVQVLVNLLRNSVDAIRTRPPENGSAPPGQIDIGAEVSPRDGQDWAAMTITDNGPGIDSEVLSRLFEPFVSTRLDAHGTGLGLAVAEGIIREHGGVLVARNRPPPGPPGAVFEILIPVRAAAADPRTDSTPDPDRATIAT
jgi:signal transduction histidine kinase